MAFSLFSRRLFFARSGHLYNALIVEPIARRNSLNEVRLTSATFYSNDRNSRASEQIEPFDARIMKIGMENGESLRTITRG